jgi:hypothetical protein
MVQEGFYHVFVIISGLVGADLRHGATVTAW